MDHFAGPKRFVLAGSGHIAGVVNPPAAQKYQYWINDRPGATLDDIHRRGDGAQGLLVAGLARMAEGAGSGDGQGEGRACPGKGKLKAIEDAPGSYVKAR